MSHKGAELQAVHSMGAVPEFDWQIAPFRLDQLQRLAGSCFALGSFERRWLDGGDCGMESRLQYLFTNKRKCITIFI